MSKEPPKWIVITNLNEDGFPQGIEMCVPVHFIKFIAPQYEQSTLIHSPTPIVGKCVITFMSMERMAVAQSFDQLVEILGAERMIAANKLN